MKNIFITIALVCCLHLSLAQSFEGYYSASFDFNQPLTNTKWIGAFSPFGLKVGYHRMLNEKFSLGADFNYGTYKEYHPKETFSTQTRAITTDYFNYIYAYGGVVSFRYYKSTENLINVYYGLGAGVAHNKYTVYYNVYGDQHKSTGFLVRPEAGMLIRFSKRRAVSGLVGLHYDYSTANYKLDGYSSFSNVGINLGIVILDW